MEVVIVVVLSEVSKYHAVMENIRTLDGVKEVGFLRKPPDGSNEQTQQVDARTWEIGVALKDDADILAVQQAIEKLDGVDYVQL